MAFEAKVVFTQRTPDLLFDYAASGAAHLPGMLAAQTTLPVPSEYPKGMVSIVQMPKGIPVATFAIAKRARPTPRCSLLRCWSIPHRTVRQRLNMSLTEA